jgi:hypothetical protein
MLSDVQSPVGSFFELNTLQLAAFEIDNSALDSTEYINEGGGKGSGVPAGSSTSSKSFSAPHDMSLTKHLTLLAELRTPGVAAGSSWFLGHFHTSNSIDGMLTFGRFCIYC